MAAFVPAAPIAVSSFAGVGICVAQKAEVTVSSVTMRCRRDLKREKQLRNMEFARAHRKRSSRNYNRRAVNNEKIDKDNEYLSSIFDTIRFGEPEPRTDDRQYGGGGGRTQSPRNQGSKA